MVIDPRVLSMLIELFDFSLRKRRINARMARKKACDIQPEVLDRGKKLYPHCTLLGVILFG